MIFNIDINTICLKCGNNLGTVHPPTYIEVNRRYIIKVMECDACSLICDKENKDLKAKISTYEALIQESFKMSQKLQKTETENERLLKDKSVLLAYISRCETSGALRDSYDFLKNKMDVCPLYDNDNEVLELLKDKPTVKDSLIVDEDKP